MQRSPRWGSTMLQLKPQRLVLALALAASATAAHASQLKWSREPPTPGRVLVAPKDRWVVAHAYANSASFREIVDQLRRRSHVLVRLESVPQHEITPASAYGLTRWAELPLVTRLGSRPIFSGVISCRARMAGVRDLAARFAHELAHAEELARYGSISRAPGVRASHDDPRAAETENAIAIGRRVREELALAPALSDAAFARQLLGPEEWFHGWTVADLLAVIESPTSLGEAGLPAARRAVSPSPAEARRASGRDTSD